MAEEGATLYYVSKQHFDFDKSYDCLKKSGLFLRNEDTHFFDISGVVGEYTEKEISNIKEIIYKDKNSGVYLYISSENNYGHRTYWTFSDKKNYFSENFTFNCMGCLPTEERLCEIFTNHAIERISEIGSQFLGFTLDMYGETETYDFEKLFDSTNVEILNDSYISDLTILPKKRMSQFALSKTIEIIEVNRDFICIAKNEKLAKYLKKLISIN